MPIEQISLLVGHSGTTVTELVYRKQIRPVIQDGATVMDVLFGQRGGLVGKDQRFWWAEISLAS